MRRLLCQFVVILLTVLCGVAQAESLHETIDQLIEQKAAKVKLAAPSNDAEFLRRVYLDLAGRIPTVSEARAFLADKSKNKREQLIDRLLQSSDYPRRMQELFHVMFMERRGDNDEWAKFLRSAFEKNLPWHQLASAILSPNPENEETRGAAFFLTQRLVKEGAMAPVDVPGLTRDIGRLFAGVDLQCAQCHDHLTIDNYKQADFQGLHMIFENIQIRRDVKFPAVSEKLMKAKKEYSSVFEQVPETTGPRIPGGKEIAIPQFEKGEEYAVAPDRKKRTPGVPKFSPLRELANGLASTENALFTKNIVNRLWFMMMGRGLVEPLDLLHVDNPATHPKLLDLLSSEFSKHKFDMRWLLKELALTKAYQRTSVIDSEAGPPKESYAVALEKRFSAEQLFWSLGVATGQFEAERLRRRNELKTSEDKDAAEKLKKLESESLEELVAASDDLQTFFTEVRKTFGNGPKEPEVDFTPTVKGALFLMHDDRIQQLIARTPGNLLDRLKNIQSPQQQVEELFLAIYSRTPTTDEQDQCMAYLKKNADRVDGASSNLMWALLTSTEFVVNH
ncbi:MAG: hypothetical protein CMJ78_26235 [Planctomycetaceae bacterium]|nr:hypothetical protein [Planctomycetaceae bacterium]